MEEFRLIYRILKYLEKSMDIEEPDTRPIGAEYLRLSIPKWSRIMRMLVNEGLVDGVIVADIDNAPYPYVNLRRPSITMKGLEYLQENSLMKKAEEMAKGIVDAVI